MFNDPQVVELYDTNRNLVKVPSGKVESISKFSGDNGDTVVTVHQNSTNSRFRREARITIGKIAADPLTGVNKQLNASVIIAFDEPKFGFADGELIEAYNGLSQLLAASSQAAIVKILNGEL